MHRKNIRAMSLILCTFTYLMIGAAVFDALESETDNKRRALFQKLNRTMFKKYNFSGSDYKVMEAIVIKSIPQKAGAQWRFAGSFYFATVVITTVGYGHSTPETFWGKMFCMSYALVGIPLGLVMFQSIGERLNTLISYLLNKIKSHLSCILKEVSPYHLISITFSIGSCIIFLGTYVFHRQENWTIFEAFYYCVITLTTIGFGDYVPLQSKEESDSGYMIFTLMFILFGLAIFSAAVNLLVLKFMATNKDPDILDEEEGTKIRLKSMEHDHTPSNDILGSSECINDISTPPPNGGINRKMSMFAAPIREKEGAALLIQKRYIPPSPAPASNAIKHPVVCTGVCKAHPDAPVAKRGRTKRHYRVRRSPTRIVHLLQDLTQEPNSPSDNDSYIFHDMKESLYSETAA